MNGPTSPATTPSLSWDEFNRLRDAEEYFDFFGLTYDPAVVNVNRLHILRKFSQLMQAIDAEAPDLDPVERLPRYQQALLEAYEVFLSSNSREQKLFKVFHQKPDNVVLVSEITGE